MLCIDKYGDVGVEWVWRDGIRWRRGIARRGVTTRHLVVDEVGEGGTYLDTALPDVED